MLKFSRKLFCFTLLWFSMFALTGCESMYGLSRWYGKTVIGVELIYYYNPDAVLYPSYAFPFDINRLEVLDVLPSESVTYFVDALAISAVGIPIRQALFSHNGKGYRLIHDDGSSLIMTLSIVNGENHFFTSLIDETGNVFRPMGEPGLPVIVDRFNYLISLFGNEQ